MGAIFKDGILYGGCPEINAAAGTHINETGTPTVSANLSQGTVTFTFDYLKGASASSAASDVSVSDTGGYFTTDNVEAALGQLAAQLNRLTFSVDQNGILQVSWDDGQ